MQRIFWLLISAIFCGGVTCEMTHILNEMESESDE